MPHVSLTVIVPFHRNVAQLARCLAAIRTASPAVQVIVAADGAVNDPRHVVAEVGAQLVSLDRSHGPAAARNRAADVASGDILVFVDADVVVHADALQIIEETMAQHPETAAVFGSYDDTPADPGFVSQCKNLAHAYIHRTARPDATTFWAGLGAVRTDAFRATGGFDERFRRPSVEDIELGYRLTRAGYAIRVEPRIQGTHLKRWTWWGALRSDLLDRGIPWTQLLHRYGTLRNDLNLTWRYRLMVVLACSLVACTLASPWSVWCLAAAAVLAITIWRLDRGYYRFIRERRGTVAALRWFPLHLLHHVSNAASYAVGTGLILAARWHVFTRASLPSTEWTPASRTSPDAPRDAGTAAGVGGSPALPGWTSMDPLP